jgi:type I restriction enzyme S subunit
MSNWEQVQLKNIAKKIGSGATPTGGQNAYQDSGISLIRSQNVLDFVFSTNGLAFINDEQAKVLDGVSVEENDILLNITGDSIARACIVPNEILPARVNQHVSIIRCKNGICSQYVFYYLQYLKPYLLKICRVGGTRNALTKEAIEKLQIKLPDILIQKRIASILSALDSKIALNNRINAELKAMAKTIYDYWFVQFDFPNAEGKPYKSLGGKMVWSEELKREVPEGWEVGTLADITNITTGKLDSNAEVLNGDYPFYTCAAEPTRTDTYAFDDTVILIAGNNASGNFHINRYKGKFNAYQRTYIVTANDPIDLEYIYQVLNVETKLLKTQGKGSQTKFLTIGMLTGIKTIRNRNVMKPFHEKVSPMYEQQEILKKENQHLSSLRDWLLSMLMNGQVSMDTSGYAAKKGEDLMAAEVQIEYRGLK